MQKQKQKLKCSTLRGKTQTNYHNAKNRTKMSSLPTLKGPAKGICLESPSSPPPRQAGEGTWGLATEGKQGSSCCRAHGEQESRSAPTHLAHSMSGPGQNHTGVWALEQKQKPEFLCTSQSVWVKTTHLIISVSHSQRLLLRSGAKANHKGDVQSYRTILPMASLQLSDDKHMTSRQQRPARSERRTFPRGKFYPLKESIWAQEKR